MRLRPSSLAVLAVVVSCSSAPSDVVERTTTTLAVAGRVPVTDTDDALAARPTEAQPVRTGFALSPGTSYFTGPELGVPGLEVRFTAPAALYGFVDNGVLQITEDPEGIVNVLSVLVAGSVWWVEPPDFPLDRPVTPDEFEAATADEAASSRPMEWLAERSYARAEALTTTSVGGRLGRSREYRIVADPEHTECSDGSICHVVAISRSIGVVHRDGDTGRWVELDADLRSPLLLDTADGEIADRLLQTLEIVVDTPPTAASTASDLPIPLNDIRRSTEYRWRSSGGVWFVMTTPSDTDVSANDLAFVDLGMARRLALAEGPRWFPHVPLPAPPVDLPPDQLRDRYGAVEPQVWPDDIIAAVRDLDEVELVGEPFTVGLGAVSATAIDVRLGDDQGGFVCAGSGRGRCAYLFGPDAIPLSTDGILRIMDVPSRDGDPGVVVLARLSAPTDELLSTLKVVSD